MLNCPCPENLIQESLGAYQHLSTDKSHNTAGYKIQYTKISSVSINWYKTILLKINIKQINNLEINLTKEVKDVYNKHDEGEGRNSGYNCILEKHENQSLILRTHIFPRENARIWRSTWQLKLLLALVWFPASMSGSSQLPALQLQGIQCHLLVSVDICTYVTYTHRHTHTHKLKIKTQSWRLEKWLSG